MAKLGPADPTQLLLSIKRRLEHSRRFGPDTLNDRRRVMSSIEGDVEEFLIIHKVIGTTEYEGPFVGDEIPDEEAKGWTDRGFQTGL